MNKHNTGIAAEFIVAAELARRDFNVAITFGNTKRIDIMIEKNKVKKVLQVKGIRQRKNNNFRLKVDALGKRIWYVFVNVNREDLEKDYEFAIMSYTDVVKNLRRKSNENDNALKVSILDNVKFKNRWKRLE